MPSILDFLRVLDFLITPPLDKPCALACALMFLLLPAAIASSAAVGVRPVSPAFLAPARLNGASAVASSG